jgi:hypothetical protein
MPRRPIAQLALLLLIVTALLAPSLTGDFVWDDFRLIVDSPTLRSLESIPSYFGRNLAEGSGAAGRAAAGADVFRPLYLTELNTTFAVFGPAPWAFRGDTVAWHLLACIGVWMLCRAMLGEAAAAHRGLAPAVALLFFGLHPVTAEGYLLASSVCEPMSACGVLAFCLALERAAAGSPRRTALSLASGLAFLFAVLSKEVALLALPPLTLWFRLQRGLALRWLAPAWSAAAAALVWRVVALSGLHGLGSGAAQRLDAVHHYPLLLLDGIRALLTLRPLGLRHLSFEYERVPAGLAGVAAVALLLAAALAWRARRVAPLAALAFAVAACMLAPVAVVSTVHGWGGFGRFLYTPSAFTAIALASAVGPALAWSARPGESRAPRRILTFAAAVLALAVQQSGLAVARRDASTQEQLARSGIRHDPSVGVHWSWLADVAAPRDAAGAERLYRIAIERSPAYDIAWLNLASLQREHGRCADALDTISLLEARKGRAGPRGSLIAALCLADTGDLHAAAERVLSSLERAPGDPELLRLQGELLELHADRAGYEAWIRDRVARDGWKNAERAVEPLLSSSAPP